MSYAFQSPRAQVSSTLPHTHDPYSHDPYSADSQQHYAPYSGTHQDQDHYRDDLGDSHDSNPSRGLHRDAEDDYIDRYDDPTRAGAGGTDANMASEKAGYGSPYAAKRASGNSIWTKEDKQAFSSRSCPAKLCRIVFGVLILAIIFIVSIILLIIMFLRPPNVAISGLGVPNQSAVTYQNGAFAFNVSVDISVSNPNSISANIKKLTANAYDSADTSVVLGHGTVTNQKIQPNANTTVVFPFQIKYDQSQDSDLSIIRNIASDCGINLFGGSSGSGDLSFLFKIDVDIEALSISVPVNINRNISFPCPLSGSSLQGILSGISSTFGGSGSSRRALAEDSDDDSVAASLVRRQLAKTDVIDMATWQRELSPVDLVAAAADGLVRRYSQRSSAVDGGKRTVADEHDAL